MQKSIPRYVATPFPPLNFNHIEKTCPKKIDKDDRNKNSGYWYLIISTGITALKISKINVPYPSNLLPVLKTFVAPILPEPISLISFFKKTFVNKNPNGIEPIRYDNTIIIGRSIFRF